MKDRAGTAHQDGEKGWLLSPFVFRETMAVASEIRPLFDQDFASVGFGVWIYRSGVGKYGLSYVAL